MIESEEGQGGEEESKTKEDGFGLSRIFFFLATYCYCYDVEPNKRREESTNFVND